MKKVLTLVLAVALVGLFGGTLWYLWRKAQKPVVVYKTETAQVADIVKKTVATGSVIPRKEVAVKPQVSGIIESIKVEAGQSREARRSPRDHPCRAQYRGAGRRARAA